MRFDSPKYVVILGMAAVGVFMSVFLFSFVSLPSIPSLRIQSPFPSDPFKISNIPAGEQEAASTKTDNNQVKITQTPSISPNIALPTIPEKLARSIALNEQEVNQLVKIAVFDNKYFSDPYIALNGDNANLTAKLLSPIKGNFSAVMIIKPSREAINIDLTQAKVNKFPIPGFVLTSIEAELNKTMNNTLDSIPLLEVEKVYVQNSQLVIEGSIPSEALFEFLNQNS